MLNFRTGLILGSAALLVVLAAACRPDTDHPVPVGAPPGGANGSAPESHHHPGPSPSPSPSSSGSAPVHDHGTGVAFDPNKIPRGVPGSAVDRVVRDGEM